MRDDAIDVVVVGAGPTGLAAALELERRGREVRVLDAGERPGGTLRTERHQGFLIERGASTLRVSAPALAAIQACGLEPLLQRAAPASRNRFLVRGGELVPVPMGPLAFATSGLLSAKGKWRLVREPFQARGDGADESVAEFVSRRLGSEALEGLVGPFLIGVYAGDERSLGAEAVFPSLVDYERNAGSILRGALRGMLAGGPRGLAGTWSGREGLGGFAERMALELRGDVRTQSRVHRLARDGDVWRVAVETPQGSEELAAARVVVATEAFHAAELVADLDTEAARLAGDVTYRPVASLALDIDPERASRPIEGFGFLVPRDEGMELLGTLFMSRLFPSRAPEGRVLATAMVGGARWPGVMDATDDEILARTRAALERILGLKDGAELLTLTRWERAIPQPGPGHRHLVRTLRERLSAFPGLALAGGWLDGVGVAGSLASGARVGAEIA